MQNINKLGGLQEGHKTQREAELMNVTPGWCSCTDNLLYGCSWWLRRKGEAKLGIEGAWKPGKEWEVLRMCAQSETASVRPRDYPLRSN